MLICQLFADSVNRLWLNILISCLSVMYAVNGINAADAVIDTE